MVRDFNGVFWPWGMGCFKGRAWFDDSAKTVPLLILMVIEEAVAAARRAEVAGEDLGAVVGCEFRKGVFGWRRI